MESIDYKGAIRRRWLLIVALALVGAVVAALFPVKTPYPPPHTLYGAPTVIGLAPSSGSGTSKSSSSSAISLEDILFFTTDRSIMESAAATAGVHTRIGVLMKDLTIVPAKKKKKKALSATANSITLTVKQRTPKASVKLTNAYAVAMGVFIKEDLADTYHSQLNSAAQQVSSLASQVQNVIAQINALTPTTTTTTTTTTTSTTTTTRPPTTTTSTTTTTSPPAAGAATAVTGASGVPTSQTTTSATAAAAVWLGPAVAQLTASAPSSQGSGAKSANNPELQTLQVQLNVLRGEYQSALGTQQRLEQGGSPASDYIVFSPAAAGSAKEYPAKSSLLDHRSVRALAGLVGGAVLGVVIAFLQSAFDRRLRTAARVQQTSTYPVVAEIPAAPGPTALATRPAPPAQAAVRQSRRRALVGARRGAAGDPAPGDPAPGDPAPGDFAVVDPPAMDSDAETHAGGVVAPGGIAVGGEAFGNGSAGALTPPRGVPPVPPVGSTESATQQLPVTAGNGDSGGPAPAVIHLIDKPDSPVAEAYRRLRMTVTLQPLAPPPISAAVPGALPGVDPLAVYGVGSSPTPAPSPEEVGERRAVLVVSPGHEPTRPLVVANLAAAYAEAGKRVVVLTTGDLRQRRIAPDVGRSTFGVDVDHVDVAPFARPSRVPGVFTVALGEVIGGPARLDVTAGALIESSLAFADVVLIEAPPLLIVTDAEAFLRHVDVVVLVAESWHTTVAQSAEAGALLRRLRAPVLGVVLTETKLGKKDLRVSSSPDGMRRPPPRRRGQIGAGRATA